MSEDSGHSGGLLHELRRRNVFKVATVYLIAAWVLIQIAETTFPALQLPDWTVTFVVVVLAILFPIAVIFAWAFEMTPDGLRRTHEVAPGESISSTTGQRINLLIIAVLLVAVVVLVSTHGGLGVGDGPSSADAGGARSIAVLPFVNMSDDERNEFFSDGLSEELLNMLAQVDGLRVAARTSSFHFKDSTEDLRDVADKLGVDHVLEGSVRKSGNRIRVTAQLIKADDGFHLWSDTYDYEVDDVFRIQDEISLAVVDALKVSLLGEERQRITRRATTNIEAHNLYLRGRHFLHQRTLESTQQARNLFQQAVRSDPDYALAYSGLSDAIQLLSSNHTMLSAQQADSETRPLLARAVALDAQSAEVWASTGLMEMSIGNAEAAHAALEKAISLNPSYAPGYLWLASVRSESPYSDPEGALELLRKVLEIDPLSRVAQQNTGAFLWELGRHEEAEAEFRRAISLDPDYASPYIAMANLNSNVYYRLDEAHRWFIRANEVAPLDVNVAITLPGLYQTLQMSEQAERWARKIYNEAPEHPISRVIPVWRAMLSGDVEQTFEAIETAQRQKNALPNLLRSLHCLALQMDGRPESALPMLREGNPELFRDPAIVGDNTNGLEFCAINALMAEGDTQQTVAIEKAVRERAEREFRNPAARHKYLADLEVAKGDYDNAIAELRAALDAGWLGSFSLGWRLLDDVLWSRIADRPEVVDMAALLDEKIAIQRAAVERQLADAGAGARF